MPPHLQLQDRQAAVILEMRRGDAAQVVGALLLHPHKGAGKHSSGGCLAHVAWLKGGGWTRRASVGGSRTAGGGGGEVRNPLGCNDDGELPESGDKAQSAAAAAVPPLCTSQRRSRTGRTS